MEIINTKKIKCKFCGYEWNTRSTMVMVSCPSCLKKNDNPEHNDKVPGCECLLCNNQQNPNIEVDHS